VGSIFLVLFVIYTSAASAEVVNKVVAIVNDEVITQQDVDQLLAVLFAQHAHAYPEEELVQKMEEAKKDILDKMIEDKLVLSRAKELDIKVIEEEIDNKLEDVKSGFPSEKEFYKVLETQGITVGNLKDRYRDQIMMKKLIDLEIKSKVSVLPSEISAYYEKYREEFKRDERYKVRHILIKAEDEVDLELSKLEIENIYDRLAKGEDFSELAKAYSEGPHKEEGGDMGYLKRGEMLGELDETVFSLKPGEFSKPVKSKLGYHIFKVEDIEHSGYFSIDEVKEDIKMLILQNKFRERLEEWVADLRKKAYIEIKESGNSNQ
jgi:parvulin-like peptidyl-prolyl isomerase